MSTNVQPETVKSAKQQWHGVCVVAGGRCVQQKCKREKVQVCRWQAEAGAGRETSKVGGCACWVLGGWQVLGVGVCKVHLWVVLARQVCVQAMCAGGRKARENQNLKKKCISKKKHVWGWGGVAAKRHKRHIRKGV